MSYYVVTKDKNVSSPMTSDAAWARVRDLENSGKVPAGAVMVARASDASTALAKVRAEFGW